MPSAVALISSITSAAGMVLWKYGPMTSWYQSFCAWQSAVASRGSGVAQAMRPPPLGKTISASTPSRLWSAQRFSQSK